MEASRQNLRAQPYCRLSSMIFVMSSTVGLQTPTGLNEHQNFGATRRSRTGDLLITNPSLNSPESRHPKDIREFRDKRPWLLGSFRTKCLPPHGLHSDSNSNFRVISHQMFPRKYLMQSKFLERVRLRPSLPNEEMALKQARFVEVETEKCPWCDHARCEKCRPDQWPD